MNRDYGGTEDFFVDIAVELVLERRSLLDRKVLMIITAKLFCLIVMKIMNIFLMHPLLAPTGALIVMMVYYISGSGSGNFFRFSLSPLMQLMLQVSL